MVYCGKPSKGCGHCRTRKIRCDQVRPACSQCIRAKRECPGYRDQLSLMFRDESQSVRHRVAKSSSSERNSSKEKRSNISARAASPSKKATSISNQISRSDLSPSGVQNVRPNPDASMSVIARPWQMPMEIQPPSQPTPEEAICFYLQANAVPGGLWMNEFVATFLMQPGGSTSKKAMQASMKAVASATLCRVRKVESLRPVARNEYLSALTLLNTALADAEDAKTNQALGAVVLLAVYEIITARSTHDIDLWTNHISGATALLDLRGTDQLNTEAGLRLFIHLRYQIIISCLQRDAPVPQSLIDCSKLAMFLRPGDAHSNTLTMIIGKLSNLRADIKRGAFNTEQEIISAGSVIEAELVAWLAVLPPDFSYETRGIKSPHDFLFQERCRGLAPYDDQYHVYPGLFTANMWNQYRCARILISEILLSQLRQISDASSLRSLSDEFRLECQTLRATIRRLAVDICRSVPFHLCAHIEHSPQCPPPQSFLGGLMLLWPMFLAAVVESPTHALRRYSVQCMKIIGHTMGMDQALALMDIAAADPGILHVATEDGESRITEEPNVPTWSMSVPNATVAKKHPVSLSHSDYGELTPMAEIEEDGSSALYIS
ncbi:hypothetical protein N7492_007306 [Penicillium capsulatum]|uniref:Zn(2)-C6 fungal-type domain-containing protein n=1 Tax=Penicillium capsulatum TaxID=69766 RepID=A0A9W9LLJ9_9EURO|nr:hypothetical protein N7492_007306 [Penicillium capsulatum]KAJ6117146.1 hypothetical protein N7512_006871 [Penicillium capsulatum]